jgi:hypothetical protein
MLEPPAAVRGPYKDRFVNRQVAGVIRVSLPVRARPGMTGGNLCSAGGAGRGAAAYRQARMKVTCVTSYADSRSPRS